MSDPAAATEAAPSAAPAAAPEAPAPAEAAGSSGGMSESRAVSFEAHLARATEDAAAMAAKLREAGAYFAAAEAAGRAQLEADAAADAEDEAAMDIAYSGCYLDDEEGAVDGGEWWPEAVLGRRVRKGKLYYKVKWRRRNVVSWELDADVENRAAVDAFEAAFKLKVAMPPTARRRFVPPSYVSRRLLKKGREPATPTPPADAAGMRPGERAVWSCEVESFIWIPYDDASQRVIEAAYAARKPEVTVMVPQRGAVQLDLQAMVQRSGVNRRIQRVVMRSEEEERRVMDGLTLGRLRLYIAGIVEFQPVHYEALARLHEEDKVKVSASSAELSTLVPMTFGDMMEQICNGVEFRGFSDECHICLDDYRPDSKLSMLPACGHAFHDTCIRDYLGRYSKLCPVCKAPIAS